MFWFRVVWFVPNVPNCSESLFVLVPNRCLFWFRIVVPNRSLFWFRIVVYFSSESLFVLVPNHYWFRIVSNCRSDTISNHKSKDCESYLFRPKNRRDRKCSQCWNHLQTSRLLCVNKINVDQRVGRRVDALHLQNSCSEVILIQTFEKWSVKLIKIVFTRDQHWSGMGDGSATIRRDVQTWHTQCSRKFLWSHSRDSFLWASCELFRRLKKRYGTSRNVIESVYDREIMVSRFLDHWTHESQSLLNRAPPPGRRYQLWYPSSQ